MSDRDVLLRGRANAMMTMVGRRRSCPVRQRLERGANMEERRSIDEESNWEKRRQEQSRGMAAPQIIVWLLGLWAGKGREGTGLTMRGLLSV